jgi:uncharacterized phiE125 gp8 family phage protein
MWLPVAVTAAPASEPISLEDAKMHLCVDTDDNDDLIEMLITTTRQHVEKMTGSALVTQTVRAKASCFADLERLPIVPVQSITSIKYLDADNVEQTLAPSSYELFGDGLVWGVRLAPNASWPSARAVADMVRVTAVVGYGAAAAVPAPLVHACKLLLGQYYDERGPMVTGTIVSNLENAIEALTSNYRVWM